MPRSIWTGAISFGLVNVPIKLYSAVSRKSVRFHQLHDETGVRIQQRRVDPSTGEEVPYDNIVKGYEIGPDRYVVVEPEELEALDPKKTRSIDIDEFVDLDQIDPIFFDHPYYLAPAQGGAKPYKLLLQAMREEGKVAIGRVVIRQKESLVAVRPVATGDVLGLTTMIFADEVVDPSTIDELDALEDVEIGERELKMAEQLIESLSGDWDPEQYSDTYRERVLELIEKKAAGEEIAVQPEEEPQPVPDLMAALEASIQAAKGTKSSGNGSESKSTAKSGGSRSKSGSSKDGSSKSGGSSSSGGRKRQTAKKS
jgi:DNA end-binding protein Ku